MLPVYTVYSYDLSTGYYNPIKDFLYHRQAFEYIASIKTPPTEELVIEERVDDHFHNKLVQPLYHFFKNGHDQTEPVSEVTFGGTSIFECLISEELEHDIKWTPEENFFDQIFLYKDESFGVIWYFIDYKNDYKNLIWSYPTVITNIYERLLRKIQT